MPIKMLPPVSSITGKPYGPPDLGSATSPLGMVGGLPDGLNPQAIKETVKTVAPSTGDLFEHMAEAVPKAVQKYSPFLQKVFAKNPLAEQVYLRAMGSQAPETLAANEAAQVAKYAQNANAHDAMLQGLYGSHPVPIPTETGWSTLIPKAGTPPAAQNLVDAAKQIGQSVKPALSGNWGGKVR